MIEVDDPPKDLFLDLCCYLRRFFTQQDQDLRYLVHIHLVDIVTVHDVMDQSLHLYSRVLHHMSQIY